MRVVALAGGTGSAKLLRGLSKLPVDLTVVVNVGDNAWMYGVYVCPDIDIVTYTLAGVADRARGWGVQGDTYDVLGNLAKLGVETWFRLGDMDLATCLARTRMIREGKTLTEATDKIRRGFGVTKRVLPVTDSDVQTWIATPRGEMHLQEFWVKERGRPRVSRVSYRGTRGAFVTPEVRKAVTGADRIIICPANPITSIGPMLAIPGFAGLVSGARGRVVALSPMSGTAPFSGPAGKLLKSTGIRGDSVGVAEFYARLLDSLLISSDDAAMAPEVESFGMECTCADTLMDSLEDEVRLAKELLKL